MYRNLKMLYWRWKLLFSNWKLLTISLILPILLSFTVGYMFRDYSGINSIPIGIIDEDHSLSSQQLINDISNSNTLKPIIFDDKSKAIKALENDHIETLFTIKSWFSDLIKTGDLNDSIEISYLENNLMAGALGDIFARHIIQQTSPYKAANQVFSLTKDENLYSLTYDRAMKHIQNPQFSLIINATNYNKNIKSQSLSTKIAHRFAIGMTLAIAAFYIMYIGSSTILEKKTSVFSRIYATGQNPNKLIFMGYTIFSSIIVFLQMIFLNISLNIFSYQHLLIVYLYTLVFCAVFVIISLVTAYFFQNPISYQTISTPLVFFICLFGGAFWSLELIPQNIRWIQYFSPVYWFLERMINL